MEALDFDRVNSCADPTCGYGQLLLSAEGHWPTAQFVGLDIDRQAVRKVRRHRPHWTVSVGDLMSHSSLSRTQISRSGNACEVLLANPPFSMGAGKGVFRPGSPYRCSVAMAHILAAIEFFRPSLGVGAIVPESLLYSDLDETARDNLTIEWTLEEVSCVPQLTFNGTRAHSTLVILRPRDKLVTSVPVSPITNECNLSADLVRGGLPVHEAVSSRKGGLQFVHSTDLLSLARGTYRTRSVTPIPRGRALGSLILLPRVGVPSREHLSPVKFTRPVQFSDCVICLRFKSYRSATAGAKLMRAEFSSLENLYRGTGARYVTVRRLANWCATVGIEPYITHASIGTVFAGEN